MTLTETMKEIYRQGSYWEVLLSLVVWAMTYVVLEGGKDL